MASRPPQENLLGSKADLAALLGASALLALGPMFVRLADVGPVSSAFWRMAIAFPLLAVMARFGPRSRGAITPALIAIIAASGVLFAADLASWHVGITQTKMANATLLGNSATFIFPLYGFLVARAWPTRRQSVALAMAATGAALLMGRSAELSPEHLVGDLLCLLAGVFYAAYFIAIERARATLAPLPLLAASTLASALPLLGFALLLGEAVWPSNWTPLVALSLCSQVVGQGLLVYALGRVSPLLIGLSLLTQPIIAALVGWLVFDETLGVLDVTGALLVGLALVLVRDPATEASKAD
ncbi:DMT family transporter [Sphingomonas sp. SUN039]|uniref:DMT family transporter n=1 Tax=Sphingomonas sp. SUN039 TaxID=2937787 RepID=UPI002164C1D8|nr:DMT family transporter [Sphingomonas sp. SUN039]UVO55140.1 DMT family transporter [Sphingomonas sp. SUN039]